MDVRFLRSFLCIANTGSVSKAASLLNIVQPALSRQVRLLEEELGTQLLVRHRRGIALTEAGRLLREHASTIIAALDDAKHAVSSAGSEPSGTVSFGLPTSMLYVLSGDVVETFTRRYKRVQLLVFEALGNVIEGYLRDGKVDVAVLMSPKPMPGFAFEPLLTEPFCLVGAPGSGLEMSRPIALDALARSPMIMFPPENKGRIAIETLLAGHGLTAKTVLEVEGQPLTLDLVRRGVGHTILPACAVEAEVAAGRLSGAPIEGASISWEIGINRARAGAPALKALVDLLRDTAHVQMQEGAWRGRAAPAEPGVAGRRRISIRTGKPASEAVS